MKSQNQPSLKPSWAESVGQCSGWGGFRRSCIASHPGVLWLCVFVWDLMARQPKMWKWDLVLAWHIWGRSGCPRGAAVPGIWGWEGAGECRDVEAALAAALGGAMEMLQLLMHRVISQAGGITVSTVISAVPAQGGTQECLTPVPAFL